MKPKIHEKALIEHGATIGDGTRVWAFAHILPGATVGEDCNICDHTFIEGNVEVGDRVTVKCGVYLWDGLRAEDDVFIGPAVVFTNDLKPRSGKHPDEYVETVLQKGCSIGANSTVLAGITVGKWALVGAGSVVTKTVPDYGVVWGNPAKLQYWICECTATMNFQNRNKFVCGCGQTYKLNTKSKTVILCS